MSEFPRAVLQRSDASGWELYDRPVDVLEAYRAEDVAAVLATVESAARRGRTAVGFLTYESAGAFDVALVTREAGPLPLVWFAVFEEGRPLDLDPSPQSPGTRLDWEPSLDLADYRRGIGRVRDWIASGDTYQVNYTFRLRARFTGDAGSYLEELLRTGDSRYGAMIDIGDHVLCSLSPELFFELDGCRLTTRPMKGTAERGRTTREDAEIAAALQASAKDRAENVMIVDMMRNDLGRVARPGTVEVSRLWEVERYRTLFQMTSTCQAETDASMSEILGALFPSASITGAPKVRTMQLIADLEDSPRGIYTGAIGRIGPGRRACFNVAIRTIHVDRTTTRAEYGTGGGIVWDSVADAEFEECRTKALVVTSPSPAFSLLETLRWDSDRGFVLLERHLERLLDSAAYFGWAVDRGRVLEALHAAIRGRTEAQRVRLLLASDGDPRVRVSPLDRRPRRRCLALASEPIDPADRFLFHKTTHREVYERAMADAAGADDVLLWNTAGELTESTIANLVVRRHGELLTPPVECGLLPGTLRAELLARGRVREEIVRLGDLDAYDSLYLVNSVRGWMPAVLEQAETLVPETT